MARRDIAKGVADTDRRLLFLRNEVTKFLCDKFKFEDVGGGFGLGQADVDLETPDGFTVNVSICILEDE
jgi:hypothetical protein